MELLLYDLRVCIKFFNSCFFPKKTHQETVDFRILSFCQKSCLHTHKALKLLILGFFQKTHACEKKWEKTFEKFYSSKNDLTFLSRAFQLRRKLKIFELENKNDSLASSLFISSSILLLIYYLVTCLEKTQ